MVLPLVDEIMAQNCNCYAFFFRNMVIDDLLLWGEIL